MWSLIQLLAGPRFCPWCTPRGDTIGWRITDRLPFWVMRILIVSRYDYAVGRVGIPLHGRLHERAAAGDQP